MEISSTRLSPVAKSVAGFWMISRSQSSGISLVSRSSPSTSRFWTFSAYSRELVGSCSPWLVV